MMPPSSAWPTTPRSRDRCTTYTLQKRGANGQQPGRRPKDEQKFDWYRPLIPSYGLTLRVCKHSSGVHQLEWDPLKYRVEVPVDARPHDSKPGVYLIPDVSRVRSILDALHHVYVRRPSKLQCVVAPERHADGTAPLGQRLRKMLSRAREVTHAGVSQHLPGVSQFDLFSARKCKAVTVTVIKRLGLTARVEWVVLDDVLLKGAKLRDKFDLSALARTTSYDKRTSKKLSLSLEYGLRVQFQTAPWVASIAGKHMTRIKRALHDYGLVKASDKDKDRGRGRDRSRDRSRDKTRDTEVPAARADGAPARRRREGPAARWSALTSASTNGTLAGPLPDANVDSLVDHRRISTPKKNKNKDRRLTSDHKQTPWRAGSPSPSPSPSSTSSPSPSPSPSTSGSLSTSPAPSSSSTSSPAPEVESKPPGPHTSNPAASSSSSSSSSSSGAGMATGKPATGAVTGISHVKKQPSHNREEAHEAELYAPIGWLAIR